MCNVQYLMDLEWSWCVFLPQGLSAVLICQPWGEDALQVIEKTLEVRHQRVYVLRLSNEFRKKPLLKDWNTLTCVLGKAWHRSVCEWWARLDLEPKIRRDWTDLKAEMFHFLPGSNLLLWESHFCLQAGQVHHCCLQWTCIDCIDVGSIGIG